MFNTLTELPFYNLNHEDFLKATGAWVHYASNNILGSKDLFGDILENPDKSFTDTTEKFFESKYRTIKQTGTQFYKANQKGFSILHCNTRSLPKNLTLLNDILTSMKDIPGIIAISETKLKDNNHCNIYIPGYRFIGTNSKSVAGGVGMYIAKHHDFIKRLDLEIVLEGVESCWVEITRKRQKNIVIGCIYRHPSNNREQFQDAFKEKLDTLTKQNSEIYMLGDMNIDFLKYNSDKFTSDYLDMLLSSGILPIITKATRLTDHSSTLIDHIYTNSPQKVLTSGICLADISDHLPIFCTIATKLPNMQQQKYYRDFSTFCKNAFLNDLEKINFSDLINSDVNLSMNKLIGTLQDITDKHAPIKKISNTKKRQLKKPWITKGILISIKKKQKLFKTHFLSKEAQKIKQYKIYNNKLTKIKETAKKEYFISQFNMYKGNIKTTWKLIGMLVNKKMNARTTINNLIFNNKCYTNKLDICKQLNSYYINVGPNLSSQLPQSNTNPVKFIRNSPLNSFMFRAIHTHEISDLILQINQNKSTIGIPQQCIKLASGHISEALSVIFNNSLLQGIVPDILKISKITPVDKGGESTDPSNYRPISTLSTFSLIFEKLICKQLYNYTEKFQILNEYQFGFRKGRSTAQAITEITDTLKTAIDNNLLTCAIFLDFSKAFDTVNHQILLKKMQNYGIRGLPLNWFTSYLTNRQQYVSLGNVESSKQTMVCGIPQGSSLGPLLFLLYINDLPNSSNLLSCRIFADDTNVFVSSKNASNLETLVNTELGKIKEWCDINKLSINFKKTNFMIVKSVRKKQVNIDVKIGNQSILRTDHIKYLGVMIDDSISWKYHISFVSSRISRNTGIISRLRYYLSLKQLKQLYYNLIYPYISYAILAWGSAYQTHVKKIQTKQNHVIRLIFFATLYGPNTESALSLLNLLEILTVHNVYKLHILTFTHLWHKKQLPDIFENYFLYASNVHSYNTRYASKQNLHKSRVRTNTGKQTTSYMAIDYWKQLPNSFKNLSTFLFSKNIKQYLLSDQLHS